MWQMEILSFKKTKGNTQNSFKPMKKNLTIKVFNQIEIKIKKGKASKI